MEELTQTLTEFTSKTDFKEKTMTNFDNNQTPATDNIPQETPPQVDIPQPDSGTPPVENAVPPAAPQGTPNPFNPPAGGYQPPQYGQPPQQPQYQQQYQPPQPQHIYTPPAGYQQKSRLAAAILAISVGAFGVHNFYLGNKGKAVVQLVVSIVGIFLLAIPTIAMGVWSMVEGIMLLIGNENQRFDGNGVILKD